MAECVQTHSVEGMAGALWAGDLRIRICGNGRRESQVGAWVLERAPLRVAATGIDVEAVVAHA